MQSFWLALGALFMAELGDKTQLITLTLAARYNVRVVAAGVVTGILVINLLSVALGGAVSRVLPAHLVQFIAGFAFLLFGLWTLRGDSSPEDENGRTRGIASPFWVVTFTFILAELGDKTMLAVATLAADHSMVPVWLGASAGMLLSNALAVLVIQVFGKRLPERVIRIAAAAMFMAFGVFSLVSGGKSMPAWTWAVGFAVVAVLVLFIFRSALWKRPPVGTEKGAKEEAEPPSQA